VVAIAAIDAGKATLARAAGPRPACNSFSATGQPLSGRFVVSEWENPANPAVINISQAPRVAWRNDTIAITWVSQNAPSLLPDPLGPYEVTAARIFSTAVLPKSDTFYVNTNYYFNGSSESLGVAIAANGNDAAQHQVAMVQNANARVFETDVHQANHRCRKNLRHG